MRRTRFFGLGLILAVALCALGAGVASAAEYEVHALPELGRCLKVTPTQQGTKTVYSGGFQGPHCVQPSKTSKGKDEFYPGPGAENKFTGEALEPEPVLETVNGIKIICSSGTFKGEYTGAKTEKLTIHLAGCENGGRQPCQSGATEGEIESEALEGTLGFIKKEKPATVGWDLKPSGATFAKYTCGKLPEKLETVEGSVVSGIKGGTNSNINRMNINSTVVFKETLGKQTVQMLEGMPKDTLTTATTFITNPTEKETKEETGLLATDEQESGLGEPTETSANQEPLEIKTKP